MRRGYCVSTKVWLNLIRSTLSHYTELLIYQMSQVGNFTGISLKETDDDERWGDREGAMLHGKSIHTTIGCSIYIYI